jgi:signal transduction histidine kinase/ActR/RegA family two-component response regulator
VKLRNHLVLLVAAVSLPLAAFSLLSLDRLRASDRDARHQAVLEATQSVAFHIAQAEAALRALAGSPSFRSEDWSALHKQAAVAAPTKESWAVVFDAAGHQLMNTRVPLGTPLPSGPAPDDLQDALGQEGSSVTGVYVGPITGRQVMRVNLPVRVEGQRYLLTMVFDAAYFSRLIRERRMPSNWLLAVFDQKGITVARSHRAEEFVGKPGGKAILDAAAASPQGRLRTVTREGIALYDTFVHVPRLGWVVANGVPAEVFEGNSDREFRFALSGFAWALVLALLGAALLGRRLSGAFGRVAEAADVVGSEEPVPVRRSPVTELNNIQAHLQASDARLRSERNGREAAEAQLSRLLAVEQEQRKRLEEENKGKDQFMAMLGHELRNPLNAIQGANAVLRRPNVKPAETSFAHAVIQRQANHLARIVDDLLEVNRVLRGKIELRLEPLDMRDVIESSLASFMAAGHGDQRQVDVELASVTVRGDRSRLEQVTANLLSNARKYTHPGGMIRVSLREELGFAVLVIQDDGVGMSEALLSTAFDVFVQGPTALDRTQAGLGIGLALVRQLVADHQGTVKAYSAGEARGTTMTVRLPAIEPEPVVAAKPSASADAGAGSRVILVEDQADARETLALLLQSEGHSVVAVGSGEEALQKIAGGSLDIAIVDIGMPGLSGYDVARDVRISGEPMWLIALTGYGQSADVEAAMAAGFNAHMVKPVDPEKLFSILREFARKGPPDPTVAR